MIRWVIGSFSSDTCAFFSSSLYFGLKSMEALLFIDFKEFYANPLCQYK